MQTDSESNNAQEESRLGGSITMLTGSESNIFSKEHSEADMKQLARHVDASGDDAQDGVGGEEE